MAKTATAPAAPFFKATPRRRASEPAQHATPRAASLEERTAVLETRWEETVPTLATSKDIAELRGEMRTLENRLIKWGVGGVIALAAVFFGMLAANTARIDRLDAKIDARFDTLLAEIRALGRTQ